MSYFRVNDKCNGCLSCVENCPASALNFNDQDDQTNAQAQYDQMRPMRSMLAGLSAGGHRVSASFGRAVG